MNYLKRMSFIKLKGGWQTYIFTSALKPIAHKFLTTQEELDAAIEACKKKGWRVSDATNLLGTFQRKT
jgi:DNA-binding transcriptional regulator YhcF (GntR family)